MCERERETVTRQSRLGLMGKEKSHASPGLASRARFVSSGRATAAQNWTPSPTSVRSTIAEHAVANHSYFPPNHLRDPFGNTRLQSTSETIYTTASKHNEFLSRTTQLRNSRSVSGLSFVRDVAESIPLPADGQLNLVTRKPNQNELHRRTTAALAASTLYNNDPNNLTGTFPASSGESLSSCSSNSGAGGTLARTMSLPVSPMVAPRRGVSSAVIGKHQSRDGYALKMPEHARKKVFIDAAFNSSNFASTGAGLTSGMGVLKAQSYFTDKNRPFGDRPNLFKGDTHTVPLFTCFSTKQTMKRHFLAPRVGSKGVF